jgi:Flp pilus assembly CpaF family ATPase
LAVGKLSSVPAVADIIQGTQSYLQKRKVIEDLVRQQASDFGIGATQADDFAQIVADDIVGLGGLESLIRDETIFNITIQWTDGKPAKVLLQRIGTNEKEMFPYPLSDSLNTFRESIIGGKAIRFSGQPVNWTYSSPHVTLYLPTHRIRIAANMMHDTRSVLASVRMNRTGQPDLDQIYSMGMIPTRGMYTFLKAMLASRATFLVVGSTGSGKTTLLRGLLHSVSKSDCLFVVEDSPELDLDERSERHDMILTLVPTKERSMSNLIRDSQRYMADRIIIGEALDDSIIDWFTVANVAGGSGLTMHAEEPTSIWRRVKNMVGSKLSEREVFERMSESVDIILFVRQRFDRDPERQIENIWVLTHQLDANGKPVYGEMWGYDPETHKTEWRGVIPESIQDKFARTGLRMTDGKTDIKFSRVHGRPLDPLLADTPIEGVNTQASEQPQSSSRPAPPPPPSYAPPSSPAREAQPEETRERNHSSDSEEDLMGKVFGSAFGKRGK